MRKHIDIHTKMEWEYLKPRFFWLKDLVRQADDALGTAANVIETIRDWRLIEEIEGYPYNAEDGEERHISGDLEELDDVRAALDEIVPTVDRWRRLLDDATVSYLNTYTHKEG